MAISNIRDQKQVYLRRMREFYHTYENTPEVLTEAMTIGWTQNVVILEAELASRNGYGISGLPSSMDGRSWN